MLTSVMRGDRVELLRPAVFRGCKGTITDYFRDPDTRKILYCVEFDAYNMRFRSYWFWFFRSEFRLLGKGE